jgi:peroxiredoxin
MATKAVLICLCLALLLGCAGGTKVETKRIKVGDGAPKFSLADLLTNEEIDVGKLMHNTGATVVTLWGMACPSCREALVDVQKVHEQYSPMSVSFVGVNNDTENLQGVRAFIKGEGLTFPTLWDRGRRVTKKYRSLDYTFSIFVINRTGLVTLAQYDHPPDLAEILAKAIDRTLEED